MSLEYTAPSLRLMNELLEVSVKADDLSNYLTKANLLPQNLPTDLVASLCMSLSSLQYGTAEGCREPLIYARKRLPAIRREYLRGEQHENTDRDSPPAVIRGEEFDRKLSELAFAVVTALDQYQSDASEAIPDSIDVEKSFDTNQLKNFQTTISKSKSLEKSLEQAGETIREIKNTDSSSINNLERQIRDAEVHNRVARTELSMPSPRIGWMKPIARKLQYLPSIIRGTGQSIVIGTDIAIPLVDRWNDLWSNFSQFVLKEMSATGETLIQIGNNLDNIKLDENQSYPNLNKYNLNRKQNFVPRSTPEIVMDVLNKLTSLPELPISSTELKKTYGENAIRDLSSLGYINIRRGMRPRISSSDKISEVVFKNDIASIPSIITTRSILAQNEHASNV